ncbi:MAG TPA: membrane protein insertase YidC [Candidatus Nitrosotenuis sp.]|nr:membrane protein insertase YidC [Candidatus Nitrosotenuis sp.]
MNEDFSTTRRVLLAFGLWMIFMVVWGMFYRSPAPQKPQESPAPATSPQTAQPPAAPPKAGAQKAEKAAQPAGAPEKAAVVPKAGAQEQLIVVENGLYRIEISNRGGVVRSWQLKNYRDHEGRPLDLIHSAAGQQLNGWPFSLALSDAALEQQVNGELYVATPSVENLRAPTEILLEWSDGRAEVTKKLKFDASYIVELETSVVLDGQPVAHGVAWRSGFGDSSEYAHAEQIKVFYNEDSKIKNLEHKKLGTPDHPEIRLLEPGAKNYAGIEDRYFAAAFLPRGTGLALWHWKLEREVTAGGSTQKEPVAEMAAGSTAPGPVALRVFVGPKALDELGKLNPPLKDLVQWGWFGIIAEPLFYLLKWIYKYVPNYGWAIILMTLAINIVMFPLKVKSWRSMQKMQKVMPEVKQIQDRYKKYSLKDPRRQQMNEEVMKVYRREGVNPMGGCLPMLLQMPIWIALYQMLNAAIELRHAAWILWIKDLSAKDPYYILPIFMAVTMYLSQKMMPATSADPAQQKMMQMMPIIFGGMFIVIPVSSGLVLYILTSNVIGMVQQWYLNRTAPPANGESKSKEKR